MPETKPKPETTRSRMNLVVDDDIAETIRIEAVKTKKRPGEVASERLRDSYRQAPMRTGHAS
ncbi:hypothetical protein [Paludisphaera mucosa]|uniref:Ribbon-helix-helix protein CopG domain-containing protein n=1 Tax=Paludisphaera mucosa TaxID=3030827 RepID=A0ABT6F6R7_9BACT|nr:hypothetical protein [Paludisphaera mucosa]MDG3003276.1 hypothetical protein [Paludisphaera mucosa]